jgi:hypothetical protein
MKTDHINGDFAAAYMSPVASACVIMSGRAKFLVMWGTSLYS